MEESRPPVIVWRSEASASETDSGGEEGGGACERRSNVFLLPVKRKYDARERQHGVMGEEASLSFGFRGLVED